MAKNISKKWILFLLIISSAGINIYFRLNPLRLNFFYDAAKENVYANISKELKKEITKNYSSIPRDTSDRFLNVLLQEYIKRDKPGVTKKINEEAKKNKENFQDRNGLSYLLEEDPYRWMRRIENFLNTGHFGTRIVNGKEWDDLKSAPFGAEVEPLKFHYYAGAYFYKSLYFFNNKISLMNALGFYPVFLSLIMVLAVFFFCSTFKISPWSAFIASVVIGISRVLLGRSSFGWFDTDIYNIIFPLIITSVLAKALNSVSGKRFSYLLLAAFLVGIYSSFWSVWWLVFSIIIFSLFLYQLEFAIYDERYSLFSKLKESFMVIASFIIFSCLFVFLISGTGALLKAFTEPFSYFAARNSLTVEKFWPDIAFTISELAKPNVGVIIQSCGGDFIVYGGIVGLLLLLMRRKRALGTGLGRFLLFVLFGEFLSAIFLSSFGLRFLILLIAPLGISFAIFWDLLYEVMAKYKKALSIFGKKIKVSNLVLCIVFIIMLFPSLGEAAKVKLLPMISRTWFEMFERIEKITPKESIINAEWDYADYIMTISKRRTLYDGSWQYTAISYWVPRAFLSQNEEEAVGIFRMLDSGGNRAFDELDKEVKDKLLTFDLINKMISMKEEGGRALLNKCVRDKEKTERILRLIYGPPPEGYALILNRMALTLTSTSSIAGWDFKRAEAWQNFSKMDKEDFIKYLNSRLGYTAKEAKELHSTMALMDNEEALSWISPNKYRFYVLGSKQVMEDGNIVFFDSGIMFDKRNLRVYFKNDVTMEVTVPSRLLLLDNGELKEYRNPDGNSKYACFLLKEKSGYKAFFLDSQLLDSVFFKLYCLKGKNLKYFKLVSEQEDDTGESIYLYKINWRGSGQGS